MVEHFFFLTVSEPIPCSLISPPACYASKGEKNLLKNDT